MWYFVLRKKNIEKRKAFEVECGENKMSILMKLNFKGPILRS